MWMSDAERSFIVGAGILGFCLGLGGGLSKGLDCFRVSGAGGSVSGWSGLLSFSLPEEDSSMLESSDSVSWAASSWFLRKVFAWASTFVSVDVFISSS